MVLVLTKGNKNITNIYFLNFINFILLRYKGITYLIFGVLHTSCTCLYFSFLQKHCYMFSGYDIMSGESGFDIMSGESG